MSQTTLTKEIPIFVAVMVWLIRVLIIGTISMAGENLFNLAERRPPLASSQQTSHVEPIYHPIGMSAQLYDERQADPRQ